MCKKKERKNKGKSCTEKEAGAGAMYKKCEMGREV